MTTLNDTERQFAEQLLLAVKNREFTVTYGKLAERVVPPANPRNVGRNIENISILCHELGLPLLSAMVVNKQSQRAGEGFYPLYEKLGIPIEGRTEAELCYQEHTAIYDCANWYKLEDALGLHVGMPRPQRTWLYIKPDKAEYCFHAVERILTTKYHQDGDPLTLSFSAGEMGRRERYKYDVINKGREKILGISWEDPSIIDGNLVSQAASNALTVFPDGWDRQQNLVDWRDINFIWDKEPTRAFKLALRKLYATDDDKGAFEALTKAVGGRFAFISYFFFLKNPERYAVMRPQWFAKQLLRLGAPTTCTDRCIWDNYQLYLAILREVREFLQERLSEPVTLVDAHSFVFSLYLVDEYKKDSRAEGNEENDDEYGLESWVILAGTEGKKVAYYTTKYERKRQYRDAAIRIHGCKCTVCGFDFAESYGDVGKGFIEVHHVKPLYSLDEETIPNPATDMVCLCPNCHRMIHRKKDGIMTVDELKEIINRHSRENRK